MFRIPNGKERDQTRSWTDIIYPMHNSTQTSGNGFILIDGSQGWVLEVKSQWQVDNKENLYEGEKWLNQ